MDGPSRQKPPIYRRRAAHRHFGDQRTLYPARLLVLPPGPVEGRTYLPDGAIGSVVAIEPAEPQIVSADAVAVIRG